MPPRAVTIPYKTESVKKWLASKPTTPRYIDGCKGLELSAVGTFAFRYKLPGRKQERLTLGRFPAMSLAEAKQAALEAWAKVERGEDPKTARKGGMTFQHAAEALLAAGTLKGSTLAEYGRVLRKDAFPLFGAKDVATVSQDDIFAMIRRINARGAKAKADYTRYAVSSVFEHANKLGYVKANPTDDISPLYEPATRDHEATSDEIRMLWQGSERLADATRLIIRVAILTGQRRKEVAGARVSEVVGNRWTVPAGVEGKGRITVEGRMKNSDEQVVYLSKQAVALFAEAAKTCSDGTYFFAAKTADGRVPHINPESISRAVARIRGKADVRLHDLRRSIETWMAENDYVDFVTSGKVLHHTRKDVTGRHYDKSKREAKLTRAWQAWADHVEAAVSKQADTVAATQAPAIAPA